MTDRIEALERLARLKAEGVLSEEEFAAQKVAILTSAGESHHLFAARDVRNRQPLYWALGLCLAAAILAGAWLLRAPAIEPALGNSTEVIAQANETAAQADETALVAKATPQPTMTPAPVREMEQPDFEFTNQSLENDRPTWEELGQGPDIVQFCVGDKARLSNLTTKPMHLKAGFRGSDTSWPIGIVKSEETVSFSVGDEPGSYFLASSADDLPYAAYDVVACDMKRNPL